MAGLSTPSRIKLGVNIDHVATVRQARGTVYPSPLEAAGRCARAGGDIITAHLREDRRHIQDADVYALKEQAVLPLNLEMANTREIVLLALDLLPEEACIVPEKREELTTEGGLDVVSHSGELGRTVRLLTEAGIEVSLFVEPDIKQIDAAAELGAPCIELHTGSYCLAEGESAEHELSRLINGACHAQSLGLRVNAGHGIHAENIEGVLQVPFLDTLNIGHSIVARSIMVGIENAVSEILEKIRTYARGGDCEQ